MQTLCVVLYKYPNLLGSSSEHWSIQGLLIRRTKKGKKKRTGGDGSYRAAIILHTDQASLDALVGQPQQPLAGVEEVPTRAQLRTRKQTDENSRVNKHRIPNQLNRPRKSKSRTAVPKPKRFTGVHLVLFVYLFAETGA